MFASKFQVEVLRVDFGMQLTPKQNNDMATQIEFVQEALGAGFCGECPTLTPSASPSELPSSSPTLSPTESPSLTPTSAPSMVPTGALDDCPVDPPTCEVVPDDGEERVVFCVVIGGVQFERCVVKEVVKYLLQGGKPCTFTFAAGISCD